MKNVERHKAGSRAVAPKVDGNPGGKGANGFLLDWYRSEPRGVVAKPKRQILAELFTSMLALSASFKYRPAIENRNFLYWIDGQWSMSLIAPEEWSDERRTGFAGTVILQRDMTWTITPSDRLADDEEMSDALSRFYDAFIETLDTDQTLEEILPFYVSTMPYYQRLYASALGRSLRTTVNLGDDASISCREWRVLIPKQNQELLSFEN